MQVKTLSKSLFTLDSAETVQYINGYLPVGCDLAKFSIQIYCYNFKSKKFSSKALTRDSFTKFLQESDKPLLVAFESGSSCHYWARQCTKYNHKVRLITTRFVASVKDMNKDDPHDAKLIYRACFADGCKEIGVKTEQEQLLNMILRLRDQILKDRLKMTNLWKAAIHEIGEPVRCGIKEFRQHAHDLADDPDHVRDDSKEFLGMINEFASSHMDDCDAKVAKIDEYITKVAREDEACKLLMTIPAVKEFSAFCLMVSLCNLDNFKNGSYYASLMGYAPRHRGTGGSNYTIKAAPVGHKTVKKCYFFIAMAMYRKIKKQDKFENCWLHRMVKEKSGKVAICAIANKLCCTAYSMLKNKQPFDMDEFKGIYKEQKVEP